jgi:hypothetical protein
MGGRDAGNAGATQVLVFARASRRHARAAKNGNASHPSADAVDPALHPLRHPPPDSLEVGAFCVTGLADSSTYTSPASPVLGVPP